MSIDHKCPSLRLLQSTIGRQRGAPPDPLICFGHHAETTASQLSEYSSLNTAVVGDVDVLSHILECDTLRGKGVVFVGISAMSRTERVGEAERAIRLCRERVQGPFMALYGAWDYNVERAANRAIGCSADGIVMPGIDVNEYFAYLFGVLSEAQAGVVPPKTVEQHIERLRRFTSSKSPFWTQQDLLVSKYY